MNSILPIKLLSYIMGNKNKNKLFSNIIKTNINTIEVTNFKKEKQLLSDDSFNVINKIEILPESKKIIRVFIESYFFDIDYSRESVNVNKKHIDCLNYPDIYKLCELLLNNNILNIQSQNTKVIIKTNSKNEINYEFKDKKLILHEAQLRKNDIILQFNIGIYIFEKYENNFNLFFKGEATIKFSKVGEKNIEKINSECNKLNNNNCLQSLITIKDNKFKSINYNSNQFCKLQNNNCVIRDNLVNMNFSVTNYELEGGDYFNF